MKKTTPMFPEIVVVLADEDSEACKLLNKVHAALRKGGVSAAYRDIFMADAKAANYAHLMNVCVKWVTIR